MPHDIHSLSINGDGIADGPTYAPYSLPGETVDGELIGNRIENPRVLLPSENRVKPPCSHFKSCGGCSMQHASDDFVAKWKNTVIANAISAHGIAAKIYSTTTSPKQTRRRATLSARRTKNGAMVGFHARGSHTIIPIPNCTLLHPKIIEAIPVLEQITIMSASRKAELNIAINVSLNRLDINILNGKPVDPSMLSTISKLGARHNIARLSFNDEPAVIHTSAICDIKGVKIEPPPGAFMQATEAGQNILIDTVSEIVNDAKTIVDLFAGCGTFSLPLAKSASVHSVESVDNQLTTLKNAWRKTDGLKPVTTEKRDLFRNPLLPEELNKFNAIVIDPPRAGAEAQTNMIANSTVTTLAFISCNPVTFARDAETLCDAGFRLDFIQPVDQFRWSSHVELVAKFTRR